MSTKYFNFNSLYSLFEKQLTCISTSTLSAQLNANDFNKILLQYYSYENRISLSELFLICISRRHIGCLPSLPYLLCLLLSLLHNSISGRPEATSKAIWICRIEGNLEYPPHFSTSNYSSLFQQSSLCALNAPQGVYLICQAAET